MRPKVSIIVPIFNMGDVLERCIDSLLAQTLADIEIIAINDGSTDHSLDILQRYEDERLIIVDQPNSGVSAARNAGIALANGAFIGFVDPDDWVAPDMFAMLYETAFQDDADIVMCGYVREFGTHSKVKQFNMPAKTNMVAAEVKANMLRRLIGPLHEELADPEMLDAWGTVWCKLYRAQLIKDNEVRFVDLKLIGSNEDTLFNIHMFYYASSFVFINRAFYHYWRANHLSITSRYNPNLLEQFIQLYQQMADFITRSQLSASYEAALSNRICFGALGLGLNIINKNNPSPLRHKLKCLKQMLRQPMMKQSFKQFTLRYCPWHWKCFFLCAKWRFTLGLFIMLHAIEWLRKHMR